MALASHRPAPRLLSRWALGFAALVTVAAVVLPPRGLGVELCLFKHLVGLPCFGCGLTRSVSCTAHGRLDEALAYNPFGVLVLLLALGCLLIHLWPGPRNRRRLAIWLRRHSAGLNRASKWLLIAFFGFGLIRVVLLLLDLWPGPRPW